MGKLLTDSEITAALRKIKKGGKTAITLADAAPRGAGRLVLIVKPDRAEWYARRFVGGRKRITKLGSYPDMPLVRARTAFANFSDPTQPPEKTTGTTISQMFSGYVDSLTDASPKSIKQAKRVFEIATAAIGADKEAGEVTPRDIVAVLKPIYDRGARVQADKHRMYMGAAFRWAIQATHDYKTENARDWGITSNPVEAVPRDSDAEGVGNRWLSRTEYIDLLERFTADPGNRTRARLAVLLIQLTGQRAEEILRLRAENWDARERLLTWGKTKNGLAHVLPVCDRAASILNSLPPGRGGWLFPNERGEDRPMPSGSTLMAVKRYSKKHNIPSFTCRDLRRTWKTLAGYAGVSATDRDLLQNHIEGTVARRNYDRYSYLPEKRAAMAKWQAWLDAEIEKARLSSGP